MTQRRFAHLYLRAHPLIQRARRVRSFKRLSLKTLGERTGYHRSTISSWEIGDASPSLTSFVDYLEGLGLKIELVPIDVRTERVVQQFQEAAE